MPADPLPAHTLRLLGRSYCHLCTDLAEALKPRLAGTPVVLVWVDLDDHEHLEAAYGEHIPVLLSEQGEICRHRLDEAALDAFLGRFR